MWARPASPNPALRQRIPAVVNVEPAIRIITTGQLIDVDGDTGEVRILEG